MDETTTKDGSVDAGDESTDESQPGAEQESEADDPKEGLESETTESDEESDETDGDSDSDEIVEWAKNKGLDINPDNPNEVKLAKMQREAESKMHEATSQGGLKESVDDLIDTAVESGQVDAESGRMAKLETEMKVLSFFLENPEARQYEGQMTEIVQKEPYLANNLKRLYQVARLESSGENVKNALTNTAKRERELLSKKQKASSGGSSATSTKSEPEEEDPIMKGLTSNK